MNLLKKIAVLSICGSVALSFSGCASADDVIAGAKEQAAGIESYKMNSSYNFDISAGDYTSVYSSDYNFDVVLDPLFAKMSMSDTMDSQTENMEMYLATSEDVHTAYMFYDEQWIKQDVDKELAEYVMNQYEFKKNIEFLLAHAADYKLQGSETINGAKALSAKGVVPASDLKAALESTGLLEYLGLSDLPDEAYVSAGPLTVNFWFDAKTYMPVKYSIDLKDIMQMLLDSLNGDAAEEASTEATDPAGAEASTEAAAAPSESEPADTTGSAETENTETSESSMKINTYVVSYQVSDVNSTEGALPDEVKAAKTYEEYYQEQLSSYFNEVPETTEP